jgi:hypothetical protein
MKKRLKKKLLKKLRPPNEAETGTQVAVPESLKLVAIECWRIKKLLPDFKDNKKHLVLGSSVDKILEALSSSGIELDDPEGQQFRDGMTLDVATFEETSLIAPDTRIISETLSPTIYIKNKLVQPAKVIVSIGMKVN